MSENAQVHKLTSQATVHVDESGRKAIRPGDGGTVATFVMSSMSADRDMERIDPNGWKVPEGNINVLVDHDYQVRNVVGKIVKTWTEGDKYLADVAFADGVAENTLAKFVVGMLSAGFLGPVSVGFMPLKWNDPDGKTYTRENPGPYWGPLPGRMYVEQELLELSMVAVGSNRDAMLVGMRAFGLSDTPKRSEADAPLEAPGQTGTRSPTSSDDTNQTIPTKDATSGTQMMACADCGEPLGPPCPKCGCTDTTMTDAADMAEDSAPKSPSSWLTKYLQPAKDSQAGADLSRGWFDRLMGAGNAEAEATKATDDALLSAKRADEHTEA